MAFRARYLQNTSFESFSRSGSNRDSWTIPHGPSGVLCTTHAPVLERWSCTNRKVCLNVFVLTRQVRISFSCPSRTMLRKFSSVLDLQSSIMLLVILRRSFFCISVISLKPSSLGAFLRPSRMSFISLYILHSSADIFTPARYSSRA